MALVKGPLFSIEARGQLAQAMVHFPWKGRAVVRKYLVPANPRDIDQKIIRQKIAICGKNTVKITTPTDILLNGSALYTMVKAKTPADNIWNAFFTKTVMNRAKTDSVFTGDSAALFGTTGQTAWQDCAIALGMSPINGVAFATEISAALQLFEAGVAGWLLSLCDATHSYSTYPSNWDLAVVSQFATNFTAAY